MIPSQLSDFFMIIYFLESATIIVQSSLIVAVLSREWLQVKRLSPVDMILISLGFCRFFLQWSSVLFNYFSYFYPNVLLWHVSIIWEFTNTLTFWLTSLHAVIYCVKVSSFTHPIFLWLRWRILRLVSRLLLGSLLISCMTVIPSAIRQYMEGQLISKMRISRNDTETERLHTFVHSFFVAQHLVLLFIPFLLFLASTVFLIASLCQHLGQMQHHRTGHCNSSLKAYSTALRYLAFFLIFFTSYFLTILVSFISSKLKRRAWFWALESAIYATVSIHSTSLMLSSPTLKKVLKVRCWGLEAA
ncbi:taste receptor type 2 member 16 [Saccopteryx bilineata]|uniref:taste receptor type 2 member 16 n=1 Tax=Saccopteryx bilineata TaxID=59482 RepID=UPI0033903E75